MRVSLDDALVAYLRRAGRELDAALSRELHLAGITPAPAGRRQTEKESTMPDDYPEQTGNGRARFVDASAKRATLPDISEQEASDRDRLADVSQWLGLLDASDDRLISRAHERPLGATLADLEEIERGAEDLEGIAHRLRVLREAMRSSISQQVTQHDERREQRLAKRNPGHER
jgi:hypothetical protein